MLNLLFPMQCGICGKLGDSICDKCYDNLKKYEIKNQHEDVFFMYKYEGLVRKLIIDYKFNDKAYLYKTFSKCLLKNKNFCQFIKKYDIMVSVPLHKRRFLERGYNQSELIAKELAKDLTRKLTENNKQNNSNKLDNNMVEDVGSNISYNKDVLIKIKNTKPQSTKSEEERIKDVKGIYEVKNSQIIKNKKVLIFDDIHTTGSTLNECKKTLLQAGAKEVGILALAKDYIDQNIFI